MPIRIVIKNPDQPKPVKMDVDPTDYIDEVIESVADFWELDVKEYLIKKGVTVYSRDSKISDTDIQNEDVLELVREEDIIKARESKVNELQQAKDWISDNVGIPQRNLVLQNESYENDDHVLIFQDMSDKKKYKIIYDQNNEVKEYRPL
jgi:hypothetical protein